MQTERGLRSYQLERFGEPFVETLREPREPVGTEILLEVSDCGVCHTDLHLSDGFYDLGDGEKLDVSGAVCPPRTLGHEIAGTIAAVGPEVQGVAVGERRVVFPWIGCGKCALCSSGNEHLCSNGAGLGVQRDGGFAESVLVPHPKYLFEYEPLSSEQACTYACSGLTAFGALKKLPALGAGDAVLIIGAGGVGLSGIRFAKALYGLAPIVAEVNPAKWDDARAAGAADVIDPSAPGAAKALIKASGGGVAAVVDFVGAAASFSFGLRVLRKAGRMVCVGLFGGGAKVAPPMLAMKALTLMGSYVGSLTEMQELMALARSTSLPELIISNRPLSEVNETLTDLKNGRVHGRVVLRP